MAKSPKTKSKIEKPEDIELVPDAWPRFERLVKAAAKMGHKPHKKAKGTVLQKGRKKADRA